MVIAAAAAATAGGTRYYVACRGDDSAAGTRSHPFRSINRALAAAQAGYDQCADQDLLEYYLYEIRALRAKHTYLLRKRREP